MSMKETVVHGAQEEGPKGRRPLVFALVAAIIILACVVGAIVGLMLRARQQAEGPGGGEAAAETELPPDSLPPPPSNIGAAMVEVFDIPVSWRDNSENEDGFHVYRRRTDILSSPVHAGSVDEDVTDFLDEDVFCGATYQYTIASYNVLGESPATECWQITLPPCPPIYSTYLRIGPEYSRNFPTGAAGEGVGDFYLDVDPDGRLMFMADMVGQYGLFDLGDIGETLLYRITMPASPDYERNGVPAILGHTYVALARDGVTLIIFTLSEIGDPCLLEYIIYHPPAELIDYTPCERLGGRTPGGPCVSGDDVCDPTCVVPDSELLGTTVPDDLEDDFEDFYEAEAWLPSSPRLANPICQASTEPVYTETDEDCSMMPCIDGDDICNPLCVDEEGVRLAAGLGETEGLAFDSDCGDDPCVTGDDICDPDCIPGYDGVVPDDWVCVDEDGDGDIDACYPPDETGGDGEETADGELSLVDGDCTECDCVGPDYVCSDGVVYYDDPMCREGVCELGDEIINPGEDCDTDADCAADYYCADDCTCQPTTPGCPPGTPCAGLGPGYPCTTADGVSGICDDCECIPTEGCPPGTPCAGLGPGYPCTSAAGVSGVCENCECVPSGCPPGTPCAGLGPGYSCTTPTGVPGICDDCECIPTGCPPGTPCAGLGPGYPCTTPAGASGTCQNCECIVTGCPPGVPAQCTVDEDCWSIPGMADDWSCRDCTCHPPCNFNGNCEPDLGENVGNCSEDCHVCGDGIWSPAGGEQCEGSQGCGACQLCINCECEPDPTCATPPPCERPCQQDIECIRACGGATTSYCDDNNCCVCGR